MYWCLGMYSSASTWLFNLVRQLAAAQMPDAPVVARFVTERADLPEAAGASLIVKSHVITPATELLAARARRIFITIRDPRDTVASLLAHNKMPFHLALGVTDLSAQACASFATDPRARLLRYEDGFADRFETIAEISTDLPGTLSAADAARIYQQTRREAIEQFINGLHALPGARLQMDGFSRQADIFDQETNWHAHHAGRSGEVGRWRRDLTAAQALQTEMRLRNWLDHFGYAAEPIAAPAPYPFQDGAIAQEAKIRNL